jgi:hypothetical protein
MHYTKIIVGQQERFITKILYDFLLDNQRDNAAFTFKHKHLWVKKATGLEVTEFFLRLMAWLCLRNDDYKNSQMCYCHRA